VLGQFLVIALPEEAFYRGYLQTRLDEAWPPRLRVLGTYVGPGLVVTSVVFALGHVATELHPDRLAVFFPSLLFGWMRARRRGIGAPAAFHALCNLFASYLARSYGLGV
jgi:membrane protease YdiL (CAAX protease family)